VTAPLRHNIELEQALLGAILVNNDAYHRVADFLRPWHFYEPVHQRIYEIAADLVGASKPATPIVIKAFPPNELMIAGMSANQYLARLSAEATTVINAVDYGRGILKLAEAREFIAIGSDIADAHERGAGCETSVKLAFERVDELRIEGVARNGTMRTAGAAAVELLDHVADLYQGTKTDDTIQTGLKDLDYFGCFRRGSLVVCGARPSIGKTTVAGTIARNAAKLGASTLFFSLEMPMQQIIARMKADMMFDDVAGRPLTVNRILKADFSAEEFDRLTDAARSINTLPLIIDDASQATIGIITAKARAAHKRFAREGRRLDLVVIDYLKFIKASDRYAGQRHYEVGEISAALKQLAKDMDVAVLLLAQLNRQVEGRADRRPQLADLRESGDLEADADAVLLLFREAYYLKDDPELQTDAVKLRRFDECNGKLEIIIAKNRMGPTGTIKAYINLECAAVRDLAPIRVGP
jgi:replicative DNA helicase